MNCKLSVFCNVPGWFALEKQNRTYPYLALSRLWVPAPARLLEVVIIILSGCLFCPLPCFFAILDVFLQILPCHQLATISLFERIFLYALFWETHNAHAWYSCIVGTLLPAATSSVPFGHYCNFILFLVSVSCSHLFGGAPCAHPQHQHCSCTREPWQQAVPAACRDVPLAHARVPWNVCWTSVNVGENQP